MQGEQPPEKLCVDLRIVYGPMASGQPLYRIRKAFDGFEEGDLATPGGLTPPSMTREDRAERIRELLKSKRIAVVGRFTHRHGLVVADSDDFTWAEPRRTDSEPVEAS